MYFCAYFKNVTYLTKFAIMLWVSVVLIGPIKLPLTGMDRTLQRPVSAGLSDVQASWQYASGLLQFLQANI
jgi:hypothetical protein